MSKIEVSVCIPYWMGKIDGNLQSINHLYLKKTMTKEQREILVHSLAAVKSDCDAIINNLIESKEVA